ncbi:LZTR1 isoform 8, partial [Pan troglodytes]
MQFLYTDKIKYPRKERAGRVRECRPAAAEPTQGALPELRGKGVPLQPGDHDEGVRAPLLSTDSGDCAAEAAAAPSHSLGPASGHWPLHSPSSPWGSC